MSEEKPKRAKKATFRADIDLICPKCGAKMYNEPDAVICWSTGCSRNGIRYEKPVHTLKQKEQ